MRAGGPLVDPNLTCGEGVSRQYRTARYRNPYAVAMTEASPFRAIQQHYETDIDEDARLRGGLGRLEFARVQEIVRRHLPPAPQRVLDVGGATGVHAEWLLEDGHQVHLIDLVPGHVDRATARFGGGSHFTAEVGDARQLPVRDAAFDVVLLFGPLYHLVERADRVATWREAARAVVPGGLVLGMGISRSGVSISLP